MATIINTIQLKRGKKADLIRLLVGDKKPKQGEPILEIDTGRVKFGNGIDDYEELSYRVTEKVFVGYLHNNDFYSNSTYQSSVKLERLSDVLYFNLNGNGNFYKYNAETSTYECLDIQQATEELSGTVKLYNSLGERGEEGHDDGVLSHKELKRVLENEYQINVNDSGEYIEFTGLFNIKKID